MGNAEAAKHLQHGQARRQLAHAMADEAHGDVARGPHPDLANADKGDEAADESVERCLRPGDVLVEHRDRGIGILLRRPRQQRGLAAGHGEADQGEDRDQDGGQHEWVAPAGIAVARAQREMQPDDAVGPDQQQQDGLIGGQPRPEPAQHGGIALVEIEEGSHHPRADDVIDEEKWDGEAKRNLQHLAQRHLEGAPLRHAQHGEQRMHDEGAVEQHAAGPGTPDPVAPGLHVLHQLKPGDADRVVDEMRRGEQQQHHAGDEPDVAAPGRHLLHADACAGRPEPAVWDRLIARLPS